MNERKIVDFMGVRRIAAVFSLILIIAGLGSLMTRGLNFGLDFTGGTLVEVLYDEPVPLQQIRDTLSAGGYEQAVVVNFGSETDVLVRLPQSNTPQLGNELLALLTEKANTGVVLQRIEFVGPQVGEELREQGGMALLLALGVVMIYIAMRFQFKFAVGAVTAVFHDVLICVGIFSMAGWDFDLTVLAALLALIGYSLNDTIVVSDRIRENFRKLRVGDAERVINISLTETLGRTMVTSFTTILVLLALVLVGGDMIRGFSLTLLIGVVVGTYSSIYVAATAMLAMGISRDDLIIPEKEGVPVDDLP